MNNLLLPVATTVFSALALSVIFSIYSQLRRPLVLVHDCKVFLNGKLDLCYCIKVINRSDKKDFTITHVWIKDEDDNLSILNSSAPLPLKIMPSEIYETWIKISDVKMEKEKVFKNVKVRLSYGKPLSSRFNKDAKNPGKGMIKTLPNVSDYPA